MKIVILAVDVGNTNIVVGVYKDDQLVVDWRLATEHDKMADEYGMLLINLLSSIDVKIEAVDRMVVSSVVPSLVNIFKEVSIKYCGVQPLVVKPGIKTGINIDYENPKEVGADRIVNAVAVNKLYGKAAIVVDFGTATTLDALSENGDYLGGAIAPGIGISTEALFSQAAKLPDIELEFPDKVIGKNTHDSLQAGILYGFVGQVDNLISRMKQEFTATPIVIATGGLANLIASRSQEIEINNQFLTLEGLKIIAQMNE